MISTIFNIAALRLWNSKQELMLALVVPILFFTIFALIFSRGIGNGTKPIKLAVLDGDESPLTQEITRQLQQQETLQLDNAVFRPTANFAPRDVAAQIIKQLNREVVVFLPSKMQAAAERGEEVTVQVLNEGSNPLGRQVVNAVLTQVVATAVQKVQPIQRLPQPNPPTGPSGHVTRLSYQAAIGGTVGSISIVHDDVLAADKTNPKIAMYAAGIAVMFLLFSATGAGGGLLEDHEAGTLDRILASRIGISQLLAGKWLYITALGCVQLTIMFVWAAVVFQVELATHLPGFAVMTFFTAAATASFALCLAALARSRAQLQGISIVLILSMSALGGSMIPRYIMSESMQRWGKWTFNAWALDGYKKVFWLELPIGALRNEIVVLGVMTIVLGVVARVCAQRWSAD